MSSKDPTSTSKPLADFSKEYEGRPRGKPCWVCSLPERGELEAGRAAGVGPSAMREWLISERGYAPEEATVNRISGHFSKGRHHIP